MSPEQIRQEIAMKRTKSLVSIVESGSSYWVGDGFPVRNLFPSNALGAHVSPFLLLDYAGPHDFTATEASRGVGEHPHRGFEIRLKWSAIEGSGMRS